VGQYINKQSRCSPVYTNMSTDGIMRSGNVWNWGNLKTERQS